MIDNKEGLLKRLAERKTGAGHVELEVKEILQAVKKEGDQALRTLTLKYDGMPLADLSVKEMQIDQAFESIDPQLYESLVIAKENIERFHSMQLRRSQFIEDKEKIVGELIRPLKSVGIYVPGGTAAYPSTVLMNAIPAKLAGVKRIVMVTPPGQMKAAVLVAAKLAGVDEIYRVGGAQGIGALAYGTATIKPVDKIVGPGNAYVAKAKELVSKQVGIDMVAGPSEILILFDETANPDFVAADLIAQAEHDRNASAVGLTCKPEMIPRVSRALKRQLKDNPRRQIIQDSLDYFGGLLALKSLEEMIDLANEIAPEHLEIMMDSPDEIVEKIDNAGAIFLGHYSPEATGDYLAGPNHTLPTNGTARFASPLGVDDFIKKTSYIKYTSQGFYKSAKHIMNIAENEGLYGHKNAIEIRRRQCIQEELLMK